MTDDPRPDGISAGSDGDADALASAYLDGEATTPERAAVEADPALLARVEAFRQVADQVGTASPVPAEASQRMLDAALAAAEGHDRAGGCGGTDIGVDGPASPPPSPAAQLADRRRRRMPLPVPAVAAAVVVLLLVGLGLLLTAGGDDAANDAASGGRATTSEREDAATADPTVTTGADVDEGVGGAAESEPSDVPTVADLGAFADEAALRATLAKVDPSTLRSDGDTTESSAPPVGDSDRPSPGEIERCDDAVRAQVSQFQGRTLDERAAVGAADLAGRPVLVYSHPVLDDPAAADQLTVADLGTCQILAVVQR